MAVGGIRAERMDPADAAWLHMDRPTNLMVVNTVLWFDAPVDQASVLQVFGDRVVSRFRRFRQHVADPPLTLAPWVAPEWTSDAGFALANHVSRTRLPPPGDQRALQRTASDLAGRPLRKDRLGDFRDRAQIEAWARGIVHDPATAGRASRRRPWLRHRHLSAGMVRLQPLRRQEHPPDGNVRKRRARRQLIG